MRAVIRQKLADSLAAGLPKLTRRDARIPAIPNKAHAVIGMRRAGKSCFLKQHLAEKMEVFVSGSSECSAAKLPRPCGGAPPKRAGGFRREARQVMR